MALAETIQAALYRTLQFFAALKASLPSWAGGGLTGSDEALVKAILTNAAQQRLFAQMSPNDQRHAVAVVRTLQQAGYKQPALLQAGLLHDVAKSMDQPLIHRVLIVLLKAFWPAALERISEWRIPQGYNVANSEQHVTIEHSLIRSFAYSSIPWWRRPFVIHAYHPAIGAAWAAEADCEPLAVRLIARHQELLNSSPMGEEEKLLAALQWADDLN